MVYKIEIYESHKYDKNKPAKWYKEKTKFYETKKNFDKYWEIYDALHTFSDGHGAIVGYEHKDNKWQEVARAGKMP